MVDTHNTRSAVSLIEEPLVQAAGEITLATAKLVARGTIEGARKGIHLGQDVGRVLLGMPEHHTEEVYRVPTGALWAAMLRQLETDLQGTGQAIQDEPEYGAAISNLWLHVAEQKDIAEGNTDKSQHSRIDEYGFVLLGLGVDELFIAQTIAELYEQAGPESPDGDTRGLQEILYSRPGIVRRSVDEMIPEVTDIYERI